MVVELGGVLLFGVLIGVISSIPPAAPGALLQIRRGLEGRFQEGMAVAVGGALADGVYCLLALLGLDYLLARFPGVSGSLRGFTVLVLLGLGGWFLRGARPMPKRSVRDVEGVGAGSLIGQFLIGLGLTGSNPTHLLTWASGIAVLSGLSFVHFSGPGRYAFPAGVIAGDVLWSFVLLTLLMRYGSDLPGRVVARTMRILGLALIGLAAFEAYELFVGGSPGTSAP